MPVARSGSRAFALDLSHVPASLDDVQQLRTYDPNHYGIREAVRLRHVYATTVGRFGRVSYRVRLPESPPGGPAASADLAGRFHTASTAGKAAVRFLKWRYGDAWAPAARPLTLPDVDAFDDEVRNGRPPVWVGRIWVAGVPELVFADRRGELGFASRDEAKAAAVRIVQGQLGADWRLYLGRYRRPWADPMPAGRLRIPDVVREEVGAAAGS
ncbi:hypothetical protein [Limnoglobus roseus]|uniref:Uncharacterized protein n=1 Tax=Limnoglobus roseus TaxID=2598579 RepID=A0A5C1AKC2_9BACT|nr:hypothetical protein [Limnoglobus roseus]QEL18653.1 hypothetical protein PX52LOC_05686 [Limnoglobus roseus]